MASSSVNVILGQQPQPLGTWHGVRRPIEPDEPREEQEQEDKRSILGAVAPLGRNTLGGYLRR